MRSLVLWLSVWWLLALPVRAQPEAAKPVAMQTVVLRVGPNTDLKDALQEAVETYHIQAGCIVSCVGSLNSVRLRLADKNDFTDFPGKHEIVSLVGTLSPEGLHLHMSASDASGRTVGGHLVQGNPVYTTAEIVIGIFPKLRFERKLDPATGSKELNVVRP